MTHRVYTWFAMLTMLLTTLKLYWEKVTKTKQQGGLGIRDIKLNNEAFLTNQAWRIWSNPNGFWAKFLKQRHFPNTHFLNPAISTYGSHS